jgi:hypothetical protein
MLQKTIALPSSRLRMQVWDIPASPWLRDFVPSYVCGAHAAVVVYSVSSRPSFEAAATWVALAQMHASRGKSLPLLLVGTHADDDDAAEVTEEEAEAAAQAFGALASLRICAREPPQAADVFCRLAHHHDAAYWHGLQEDGVGAHLGEAYSHGCASPMPGVSIPPGALASGRTTPEDAVGASPSCCSLPDATARALKSIFGLFLGGGGGGGGGGNPGGDNSSGQGVQMHQPRGGGKPAAVTAAAVAPAEAAAPVEATAV